MQDIIKLPDIVIYAVFFKQLRGLLPGQLSVCLIAFQKIVNLVS